MKKNEKNLYLLYMLFGVSLVTANAISGKIFNTGIMLFGSPVTLTVGAVAYPLTFLITDVIGEIWGKKKANSAVLFGFICQVVSTAIIIIGRYLPSTDVAMQNSYVQLMGQNWVFVLASLSGYICSQSWDVWVFHTIRNKYIEKYGSTKGGRWIWNNLSTMTSQVIDTVIFVTIAFGFGFGWLFKSDMRASMFAMMFGQYLLKFLLAALDTPIFYILTRKSEKEEMKNEN